MRIRDWSSDLCSSDLEIGKWRRHRMGPAGREMPIGHRTAEPVDVRERDGIIGLARLVQACCFIEQAVRTALGARSVVAFDEEDERVVEFPGALDLVEHPRSEEHTSELQSLMRISYAVFCLKNTQKLNNN